MKKKMKKILFIIAAMAALTFTACETEGDISNDIAPGYYTAVAETVFPSDAYKRIILMLDGNQPLMGEVYVSQRNPQGLFQVVSRQDSTVLLEKEITVTGYNNETIKVIELDKVYFFEPENLTAFKIGIKYLGNNNYNGDDYSQSYSSGDYRQHLEVGGNYVLKGKEQGRVSVMHGGSEVYAGEVLVEAGGQIDLLQMKDSTFINISIPLAETDPQDEAHTKVRFMLDPALNLTEAARITVSDAQANLMATLDFDAKELSGFVEIEKGAAYKYAIYNMADPANPALIRQNITLKYNEEGINTGITSFYKFQTIQAGRYSSSFLLGTTW